MMFSSVAGRPTRPVAFGRVGRVGIATAMGALLFVSGAPSAGYAASVCTPSETTSPEYYQFQLITTRNVPGTGRSSGLGKVTFSSSPFVVSIGEDGSYQYDLTIEGVNLRPHRQGVFVAWAMTPEIDQIVRLGTLDEKMSVSGHVKWNKFLVAITLETTDDPESAIWSGPVVMRGVSRSGLMHTMAGHGPLEQELCAKYGFGN